MKKNKLNLIQRTIELKSVENSSTDRDKNHVMKFSQYSFRKDLHQDLKNKLNILSYIDPYVEKIQNKSPDFNKMSHRNENDLLNMNSVGNPSICYYEPNYNYVLKSPPKSDLKFTHSKKFYSRKYLVQKMWRSYNVSSDYKLVQIKSLVDK